MGLCVVRLKRLVLEARRLGELGFVWACVWEFWFWLDVEAQRGLGDGWETVEVPWMWCKGLDGIWCGGYRAERRVYPGLRVFDGSQSVSIVWRGRALFGVVIGLGKMIKQVN